MAIPPGQEKFALTGYCMPECTDLVIDFFYFEMLI